MLLEPPIGPYYMAGALLVVTGTLGTVQLVRSQARRHRIHPPLLASVVIAFVLGIASFGYRLNAAIEWERDQNTSRLTYRADVTVVGTGRSDWSFRPRSRADFGLR